MFFESEYLSSAKHSYQNISLYNPETQNENF